ncbi:MAG: RHS repeat-associated core domain-containing protein [Acidimicrobiales bacterium]
MNDRVWTSSKVPARTPGSTGARRSQVSASCRGNTAPRYHPIRCPHGRPAPFAGGSTRVGEARHHRTYCAGAGPHYLIGRYYDPQTGQFLSVDPQLQQTQQAYIYVGDDPVNGIDPEGTSGSGSHGYAQCGDPDIVGYNVWRICERENKAGIVGHGRDLFSWVKSAANGIGHYLETHKVVAGIALGVIAVATGGTAFFVTGEAAALILSATASATGAIAAQLDTGPCLHGDRAACVGAALGWSSALTGAASTGGLALGVAKESIQGAVLFGLIPGLSVNLGVGALSTDSALWLAQEINSHWSHNR